MEPHSFLARRAATAMLLASAAFLAACEPLSLTALGIGGSAAMNHKMNGTPYRTFTAPIARVRVASIGAMKRMGINSTTVARVENGELITARAGKREIEIELEAITPRTTRMRVVARDGGLLYDGSTASEIIVQTGKSLGV